MAGHTHYQKLEGGTLCGTRKYKTSSFTRLSSRVTCLKCSALMTDPTKPWDTKKKPSKGATLAAKWLEQRRAENAALTVAYEEQMAASIQQKDEADAAAVAAGAALCKCGRPARRDGLCLAHSIL